MSGNVDQRLGFSAQFEQARHGWQLARRNRSAVDGATWLRELRGILERTNSSEALQTIENSYHQDLSRTAASIAEAVRRFVPEPVRELVASGGGAENPALIDAITAALPSVTVRRFSDVFFDGEAKEAVAFALLGYLHLMREPGNLPSVTGARGPRILGQLTPA